MRERDEESREKSLTDAGNTEFYELLCRKAPFCYHVLDSAGAIRKVNDSWLRMFGYSADDAIGTRFSFFLAEHSRPRFSPDFDLLGTSGEIRTAEYSVLCCDGSSRDVLCDGLAEYRNGEFFGAHFFITDVTARNDAEKALRESEERFCHIFEQTGDAIIIFDLSTELILDVNSAAEALFGYSKGELTVKAPELFGWLFSPGREGDDDTSHDSGKVPEMRYESVVRKNGDPLMVSCRCEIMTLKGRSAICCGFRDETEKARMREESRLIQSKLVHANKMTALGMLVSEIAHEINNPNNFIMFNVPLLLDAWQDAMPILEEYHREHGEYSIGGLSFEEMRIAVPRLLSGIHEGSTRIKNIIDNLRSFVRQDREISDEDVDINGVVRSALFLLRSQIGNYTDSFREEYDESVPPVRGNARKLEQVIINLVINALQALPEKRKSVAVSTSRGKAPDTVEIRIEDEGVGMSAEQLSRIREPFFSSKQDSEGLGLGLYISFSIVERHRGTIKLESAPGRGTAATIVLPMVRTLSASRSS